MATRKTADVLDNAADDIAASFRAAFFEHKKRSAQLAALKQHELDGTLPPDLAFKVAPIQLPATFPVADAEELRAAERRFLDQTKSSMLSARISAYEKFVASLAESLETKGSAPDIRDQIIKKIPAIAPDKKTVDALVNNVVLQISAFKTAQSRPPPSTATALNYAAAVSSDPSPEAVGPLLRQMLTAVESLSRQVQSMGNGRRLPPATAASARDPRRGGQKDQRRLSASRPEQRGERSRSATPGRENRKKSKN